MLGENYATNTWPSCGEIDIMEFKGSQPTTIYGTLHYPGNLVVMEIVVLQPYVNLNFTFTKPSGPRFSKIYVDDAFPYCS
jgi:beta-glucanase (GH16 family)